MITAEAARQTRYRNHSQDRLQVGDACDFDFGLRLTSQYDRLWFLNEYTAMYRLTDVSVGQGRNCQNLAYDLAQAIKVPEDLEQIRQTVLSRYASSAVTRWIELGEPQTALEIFMSRSYSWQQRLSLTGLIQAFLIACPAFWRLTALKTIRRLRSQPKVQIANQ
jgi:hypothetical protein